MLERPNLTDEEIARCLYEGYGISVQEIVFLPIGYDSTASVFRLERTDGRSYFLKTKTTPVASAPLQVPHFLQGIGIDTVVAPIPTQAGSLSTPLGQGFTAILYPFVEGRMGAKGGLSARQWIELGQVLYSIHASALPAGLIDLMRREPFVPLKGELAWSLHREVASSGYTDPICQELAAFWHDRNSEIEAILRRAEVLGRMAQARQRPIVLCHADIHTFNVLVAPDEQIFIIDWDETILAPKERDLMFLVDGTRPEGTAPHPNEAAFRQGYGSVQLDPVILAFYRYEWVVQEIAEFGKQVLRADESGEITRLDGLRHFRGLFAAGDVVEGAYRSDV